MLKKTEEHDISDKELSESYWLVTHWEKIQRISTFMLAGFAVLVWLFVAWNGIVLYLLDFKAYRAFVSSLPAALSKNIETPLHTDLSLSNVIIIPAGEGRYDTFAILTNPNTLWRANVSYTIFQGGGAFYHGQTLVYPTQTRAIISPSISSSTGSPEVRIELTKISWYRIRAAEKEEIAKRQNFVVKDVAKISTADDVQGVSRDLTRVAFTVTNDSIYNFWEVEVPIVLKSGGQIVAVSQVSLQKITAGETRKVFASWPSLLPTIDGYDISPQVDVLNPKSYWFSEKPLQRLGN